jgi:hypothetical protein
LINTVSEKEHYRFYGNHIPVQKEEEIRRIIKEYDSNIRLADEFYPEIKKKEKELAKLQRYFT